MLRLQQGSTARTALVPQLLVTVRELSHTGSERREHVGVGAADREFNVSEQRIRANVRVTGIGGATGWARIFGRLTPNSSIGGAVRMTANYYRQGSAVGGNADIRFFVRETGRPSSTAVFRTVESPGFVQGNTTRSEQFVLPTGVQHDIGIEIRTSVDTIAAAYFYADYFSRVIDLSRRRVVLNRPIRIEGFGESPYSVEF